MNISLWKSMFQDYARDNMSYMHKLEIRYLYESCVNNIRTIPLSYQTFLDLVAAFDVIGIRKYSYLLLFFIFCYIHGIWPIQQALFLHSEHNRSSCFKSQETHIKYDQTLTLSPLMNQLVKIQAASGSFLCFHYICWRSTNQP